MARKLLTLEDLYGYYSTHKRSSHFSSKDSNDEIVVQVDGKLNFKESETNHAEGLSVVTLQACHTLENVNGSYIEDSVMESALPSFSNRPILGYVWRDSEGKPQFEGHNMHLEEINGEETLVHDEVPIGIIPESCNARLEYDEEKGKNYCVVDGLIFDDYSPALEILQRDEECSVSVELTIRDMSFDAKSRHLNIEDFYFSGVTILGKHQSDGSDVKPGMVGSNIKLKDFSKSNNSVFSNISENESNKMIELLSSINEKLDNFNNINSKEGGNDLNHFEELLEKYNVTVEDVTFEHEGLSDEELDALFEENFGEKEPEPSNEPENPDGDSEPVEPENPEEPIEPEDTALNSLEPIVRTYEISHEDTRYALYALLASYEEADGDWYFINNVFDSYFTYENWNGDKVFGQAYTKDGDNVAFDGERYNLHRELLTDSEYAELQSMRANYVEISEKAAKYDYSVLEAERVAEFEKEEYSSIKDKPEYAELAKEENHKDFSLEEVQNKLNEIILSYAKAGQLNFAVNNEPKAKVKVTRLPMDNKSTKKSRYGTLFSKAE